MVNPEPLRQPQIAKVQPPVPVKMNLLDNSLDFLREGLDRVVAARKEPSHWKFAALCFCQATELALKARLQRDHAALVYSNLDKPSSQSRTVTLEAAVHRLTEWCGIPISVAEKEVVKRVTKWRNDISHWEFDLDPTLLQIQLAALLAFLNDFYRSHLDVSLSRRLGRQLWQDVVSIQNFATKLRIAALKRIKSDHPNANIDYCEQCGSDTRVDYNDTYECFVCGDSGEFFTCARCGESKPDYERDESVGEAWCTSCVGREQYADEAEDWYRDWRSS
jgi:rRNA maturation endonuclease Nob1